MSTFTLTLKEVIAYTGGTTAVSPITNVSVMTGGNIGLSGYAIFDPTYKPTLDGKIIDHFFNREIGMETIPMFQLAMRRKMNEIMPYYNKIYNTEKIAYDPLSTVNLSTIGTGSNVQHGTNEGTSLNDGTSDSQSRAVSSDTPQTQLSGSGDYATNAADSTATSASHGTGSTTATSDANVTEDSTNTVTGYQGIAADLIMRYRESLLNIDLMVLGNLDELFMQVWDNGDNYSADNGILMNGWI